jgi:2-dehydro-3-deoxygluconokinase
VESIAAIGECMLELSRRPSVGAPDHCNTALSYGGDTLNTAVYLSRLGQAVSYVTALGDDPLSGEMIESWQQENIDCSLVDRHEGAVPGLYFIDTDASGERSFLYWRDQAPAKRLLDDAENAQRIFSALATFDYVYLSGITLAILTDVSRDRLLAWLPEYREAGGKVIFDNNYRPRLWPSTDDARACYSDLYKMTDIALPTFDDECLVFGPSSEDVCLQRLLDAGVKEIVLKLGAQGCRARTASDDECVYAYSVTVRDTTAAGDSFNAGFLARRLGGATLSDAADFGCRLASVVVQHPGAIIDTRLLSDLQ